MGDEHPDPRDTLEYQPRTDTYRVEYTDGVAPPSRVVVKAIATITGRKPVDLDPLYEVLDPAALDDLFRATATGGHRSDGEISFTYHGYEVVVRSYGVIEIRALDADESTDDTAN